MVDEEKARHLLEKLSEMTLLLVKMSVQCRDFLAYSPSTIVTSALYAATAFLKHSNAYTSAATVLFVEEVRANIFMIIEEESRQHELFLPNIHYDKQEVELMNERINLYQRQFTRGFIE